MNATDGFARLAKEQPVALRDVMLAKTPIRRAIPSRLSSLIPPLFRVSIVNLAVSVSARFARLPRELAVRVRPHDQCRPAHRQLPLPHLAIGAVRRTVLHGPAQLD